ncbi:discoidin domain-containing protein, partial [Streptomyces sp. NRRL WC-3549]|uniref:discoidin domain-containing protein n=1 Tax=Streptomyces sp. NRRL WC-3549 TaxID=1463925 RepID=UPI000564E1CC
MSKPLTHHPLPEPRRHLTPRRRGVGVPLIALGALLASSLTLAASPSAGAAETLLSQGRTATASSQEGEAYPASAAVDGDLTGTRWASAWSDPQWIQVDLGSVRDLSRIVLTWEAAHAEAYQIQASDNGTDWRTLKTVTGSDGGTDDLPVSGSGRYVRMLGTARAGGYGYSLWECQVYG